MDRPLTGFAIPKSEAITGSRDCNRVISAAVWGYGLANHHELNSQPLTRVHNRTRIAQNSNERATSTAILQGSKQ